MKKMKYKHVVAISGLAITSLIISPLIIGRNNNKIVNEKVSQKLSLNTLSLDIANSITVGNPDIVKEKNVTEIRTMLETKLMTQEILDQLSIIIPSGILPADVSFKQINIDNLFKVSFTINYQTFSKSTSDHLNATPSDQEIVNIISISNTNILSSENNIFIQNILETNPMTESVLNTLSIFIPSEIDPSKVSFRKIDINNIFKVSFTIYYNGVEKNVSDYLKAAATDLEVANSITITNPNALVHLDVNSIRNLLEVSPMTVDILNQLSINMLEGTIPGNISFTDIKIDNPFKVIFVINYNGTSKTNTNFLSSTPHDKDVANLIFVENPDIISGKKVSEIEAILNTPIITQNILNQLSIRTPDGITYSNVSFTSIDTTNPFKVTFIINYNGVEKDKRDFLNASANSSEVVNSIIINDNDSLKTENVIAIRGILETRPMTQDVLNRLSVKLPDGGEVAKITFRNINITNLFKVTFTIYYNGVAKSTQDFLNATPGDQDIARGIIIQDRNILKDKNAAYIQSRLENEIITEDILNEMSIKIPEGIDIKLITFEAFDTSTLFRISFIINYNNVPKDTLDWLNTTSTNEEIANQFVLEDIDILKDKNVTTIRSMLETKPMTQTILTQLGIKLADGVYAYKISFTNINIDNLYKIYFTINYDGVAKNSQDWLTASPSDEEVLSEMIVKNVNILSNKNNKFIENLLTTELMTEDILNQLSITIPIGISISKVSFSNIKIENPLRIFFTINYNGVPKSKENWLNSTATNQEIAESITITNTSIMDNKDVNEIKEILEIKPTTLKILSSLSIVLYEGVDYSKVSFTNINIDNLSKISFTINYNGVPKENIDFLSAKINPNEVLELVSIGDVDVLKNESMNHITDILRTSNVTLEVLDQLSLKIPDWADASKISFTNIKTVSITKISFNINYNKVQKKDPDFLSMTATDQEIANLIVMTDSNIMKDKNMDFVIKILTENPISLETLNKLSIQIPEGSDITKISFDSINSNDTSKVSFNISYNGFKSESRVSLNVTTNPGSSSNVLLISGISGMSVV
ncbi:MAG: hypothetical protein KFW07_03060, partial [Mycoplasmataceae bacterium]|nr:hypothetical protein [Mycoplasmataceae bacterium]